MEQTRKCYGQTDSVGWTEVRLSHCGILLAHRCTKNVINLVNSYWPSYRSSVSYIGPQTKVRGLPVGFLLLRYSVLFTVESLSLLYLLVIS